MCTCMCSCKPKTPYARRIRSWTADVCASDLQGGYLLATALRHALWRRLAAERFEGRADHVVWVRRAHRLGDDIGDAERFEDRAHRAAGDDAGSRRRRAQRDAARAEMEIGRAHV